MIWAGICKQQHWHVAHHDKELRLLPLYHTMTAAGVLSLAPASAATLKRSECPVTRM